MLQNSITRTWAATLVTLLAFVSPVVAVDANQDPIGIAIALITVYDFEHASCPLAEVVETKWEIALSLSGIDFSKDMPAVIDGARKELAALHDQHQDEAICARFWELFGPSGRYVPDILRPRS